MKKDNASAFPPFTEAVVITGVYSGIALVVIPNIQSAYTNTGQTLPAVTRMIFLLNPLGVIGIALIMGLAGSLGRLKVEWRWMLRWSSILLLVYGAIIVAGLTAPVIL